MFTSVKNNEFTRDFSSNSLGGSSLVLRRKHMWMLRNNGAHMGCYIILKEISFSFDVLSHILKV